MKQVHWQLPFASLNGTQYRIDIYAEGECATPVQLTGAANSPFETDIDSDDEKYAPMRGSTGSLTIVSDNKDILDGVMPEDAIDHMVQLIRVSDDAIMWQGFLSCEAYTQSYKDRYHEVTIPVNSVLEAMKNVTLRPEDASYKQIRWIVKDCFELMYNAGVNIGKLLYPVSSWKIFTKYLDETIMYDKKEYNNEGNATFELEGWKAYDVLSAICTYMGWTLTECGRDFMFYEHDGDGFYYSDMYGRFRIPITDLPASEIVNISREEMSEMVYKAGEDHSIDRYNGAKSVDVSAKLTLRELNLGIPDFPGISNYRRHEILYPFQQGHTSEQIYYGYQIIAGDNDHAMPNIEFGFPTAEVLMKNANCRNYGISDKYSVLQYCMLAKGNSPYVQSTQAGWDTWVRCFAGAFFAKIVSYKRTNNIILGTTKYDPEDTTLEQDPDNPSRQIIVKPEPASGIHCVFMPRTYLYESSSLNNFDINQSVPILKMRSMLPYHLRNGYINIQADFLMIVHESDQSDHESNLIKAIEEYGAVWRIGATLKVGNSYWNGESWQNTMCYFLPEFHGGNLRKNWNTSMDVEEMDGLLIPAQTGVTDGEVEFWIWPIASPTSDSEGIKAVCEMFFRSLNITFHRKRNYKQSSTTENHYYQRLDTHFSEDKEVSLEIASSLDKNKDADNLIYNDPQNQSHMSELEYQNWDGSTKTAKPERVLLEKMVKYYSKPRRVIGLDVKPSDNMIQLIEFNGYDGRVYKPLYESRDWKKDKCHLSMFEVLSEPHPVPPPTPEPQIVTLSSVPVASLADGYCNQSSTDKADVQVAEIEIPGVYADVVADPVQKYWQYAGTETAYKMKGFVFNDKDMYLSFPEDYNEDMVLFTRVNVADIGTPVITIGVEGGSSIGISGNAVTKYGILAGKKLRIERGVPFAFINVNDVKTISPNPYMAGTRKNILILDGYDTAGQPAYSISLEYMQ